MHVHVCLIFKQSKKNKWKDNFLYLSYVLLSVEPEALQTSIVENL